MQNKELFKRIVPHDQDFNDDNYAGKFKTFFCKFK